MRFHLLRTPYNSFISYHPFTETFTHKRYKCMQFMWLPNFFSALSMRHSILLFIKAYPHTTNTNRKTFHITRAVCTIHIQKMHCVSHTETAPIPLLPQGDYP